MPQDSDSFPEALLAYFFRSAVAYYNAKPWQVLGESDTVRILVNDDAPYFAFANGSDGASAPGLTLTSAFPADDQSAVAARLVAFGDDRLSLTFGAEHDAPGWLRDMRRANKWPLASPSAFPMFVATGADGVVRELTPAELRALAVGVSVMAAFVGKHRKQILSRAPHGDMIKVRDEAGELQNASVQYPFDADDLSGWRGYKFPEARSTAANKAFHEVWNAALDLPYTPRMLERLLWSFFLNVAPEYLAFPETPDDDLDAEALEEEGYMRFVSWALFAYRTEQGTLAEQALVQLALTKSNEELEVHRRVVLPRAGVFRVTEVQRRVGFRVHDTMAGGSVSGGAVSADAVNGDTMPVETTADNTTLGDTLEVVDRSASRQLEVGCGVLGMLHPISDTQWVLSPGAALYPSVPDLEPGEDNSTVESFATTMEENFFGANTRWIQELTGENVRHAYEAFEGTLADLGDTLPDFDALQAEVARTDQPSDVVRSVQERIVWWSDNELNVMLAFVMRVWNVTPRAELGGKTPEEMYASGERVRAKRPAGGGRRR